jgi:pimeloyl-ACP methyl ester carboxylesterase
MTTLIARLGVDEVDWVGTSFGGYIGMETAARKGSPLRRLVLNDFGARGPGAALRRIGGNSGRNPQFPIIEELETYLRVVLAPYGELTDLLNGGIWPSTVLYRLPAETCASIMICRSRCPSSGPS